MRDRKPGTSLVLGGLLALGSATTTSADVALSDVWNQSLTQCVGCHGADQNGGMRFNSLDLFYSQAVNVPSNRSNSGKLRVHPYAPELSFLVDKLWGHVKAGEGDPMLRGGPGLVYTAPGHVAAIEAWIRAGAPPCTGPKGTDACPTFLPGLIEAGRPQPAFAPEPPAGATITLAGETFTVSHVSSASPLTRDGTHASPAVTAANPEPTMVTALSIQASAGTEWVALYRGDEEVPVAVARGERLDLALPQGVGVPIEANQPFRIVQQVRNDYFLPPGDPNNPEATRYHNATTGEAVVYLTTDDAATTAATPFVETTGSDLLFVPARRVGVTGGVWTGPAPEIASGAAVGIWADRRAIAVALVDPAAQQALTETGEAQDEPGVRAGYVDAAGAASIVYSCVHNNGASNAPDRNLAFATVLLNDPATAESFRPVRSACTADANTPSGFPELVAGALGATSPTCWRSHVPSPDPGGPVPSQGSDCEAPAQCRAANLVAGPTSDDGRCTLVGLWW